MKKVQAKKHVGSSYLQPSVPSQCWLRITYWMSQGFQNLRDDGRDEFTKTCVGTLPKSWGGLFKMLFFFFKGLVQLQMKYMAQIIVMNMCHDDSMFFFKAFCKYLKKTPPLVVFPLPGTQCLWGRSGQWTLGPLGSHVWSRLTQWGWSLGALETISQ